MTTYPKKKILLALPPYWTPQIPPLGISCLKSYLQGHGYRVTTVDANVEVNSRGIYNRYFDVLRNHVSGKKRGNFYNIGHDVLQNHLMAHIHAEDESENKSEYTELVKTLIFKTFFVQTDDTVVEQLNRIVGEFYSWLDDYFSGLIEREKPDVLGLSTYRGNLPAAMYVFKTTKERHPHIQTVMGGAIFAQSLIVGTPNFDFFLEKTRDYLDHLVVGEGEQLFLKLLQGRLPQDRRVFTLADNNVETLDLANAPVPDFSGLDLEFYPNLASYTSRSCPFQCTFCTETIYWGGYRKKKTAQVVSELRQLHREHGRQIFLMCDSLLNPIATGLAREFIDTDPVLYWDGYLRVDTHSCNPETVMLWRRGGFYRARLGVESGSRKILDAMDKRITLQQIKTTIKNLADAGIKSTTYWIVGYPGETEDDFQLTLDIIEELKDDIYEAECNPFGYYPDGQVKTPGWDEKKRALPLYPESTRDMLVTQTWILDGEPSRETTYQRINRFVRHCSDLGIPNPYSLNDINNADQRWKKLHKNAVPPLLDFKGNNGDIDETKYVKAYSLADHSMGDAMEFGF